MEMRGNTPPELCTRYKSLVGGGLFPCPTTRPDCLFVAGIHARAMDFATEDLFKTALYFLVFLGQTHKEGITYTREGVGAREYTHWSDSDWAVRRSTTGGTGQLAPPTIVCQPLRAARTASVPPQVCYMPFASMARGEGAQAVGAVATTGAMAGLSSQCENSCICGIA